MLEEIYQKIKKNVDKDERETTFNIYNGKIKIYTSDCTFIRHWKKKFTDAIERGLMKVNVLDDYGVEFITDSKYMKFGFPSKETSKVKADAANTRHKKNKES